MIKTITALNFNKISDKVSSLLSKNDKTKTIPIEALHTKPEFQGLYQQEPEKVSRIAEDIKANGYDKSQPIIVQPDNTIIDGHSRYLAAKQAGLKFVPVIYKDIPDENVLIYMEHLQLDRRNLTDAEKVQHFKNLMQLKAKAKSEGKSVENFSDDAVAKQLNISARQVQKIREVENKATPEQLDALKNGTSSINQIHTEIKAVEKTVATEKKVAKQKIVAVEKKASAQESVDVVRKVLEKNCFEIPENTNEDFLEIAQKTKEFVNQLVLYAKSNGNEKQSALLEQYSSADMSAKEVVSVWNSIISALAKSLKR